MNFRAALLAIALTLPTPAMAAESMHVLRVRGLSDPQMFDWNRATTAVDAWVLSNLMEGLAAPTSKSKAVPALASRWKASADFRTWTFSLRKGVKWSDGVPLKAKDFVASWERLLAPATGAGGASFLFEVENAEAFNKGRLTDFRQVGIKALDDATLQVKLRAPNSTWYWVTTAQQTYPIREDLVRQHPLDWTSPSLLVTLGPFTLLSHETGRQIVLARNPFYYGKRGNLEEIDFGLIPDEAVAIKLFESGQLDIVPKLSGTALQTVAGNRALRRWPALRLLYLKFNTNEGPTADPRLRKALTYALDRSKLPALFKGTCMPATSIVPPGLPAHAEKAGLGYDPARARSELAAASPATASVKSLKLLGQAIDDETIAARFIENELKRNLGIEVKSDLKVAHDYYSARLSHKGYSLDIQIWANDFPDPDNSFSLFTSAWEWTSYPWNNATYDALVAKARSAADIATREGLYRKAEKLLLEDDVIAVPLCYTGMSALVRDTVKGFDPGPMSWWHFKDLSK